MLKKSLHQTISHAVEFLGTKTAEKSLSQSCCFMFYQPKEPTALKSRLDTRKTTK
jgi:cyclic lactone autoinducer peptide